MKAAKAETSAEWFLNIRSSREPLRWSKSLEHYFRACGAQSRTGNQDHLLSRVIDASDNSSDHGMGLQEYIARFGHGSAKLARQAQSKEKTLEKMVSLLLPVPGSIMSIC